MAKKQGYRGTLAAGAVLGAIAGAAVTLWNSPRAGDGSATGISDRIEQALVRATGMSVWQPDPNEPGWDAPAEPAAPRNPFKPVS